MLVRNVVLRDLADDPNGEPLSVAQAAMALGLPDTRVVQLVRDGNLAGTLETGRVISVGRQGVRRMLGR